MRSVTLRDRKKRRGRHAAPSHAQQLAKRAGRAAPALAIVAAVAAIPIGDALARSSPQAPPASRATTTARTTGYTTAGKFGPGSVALHQQQATRVAAAAQAKYEAAKRAAAAKAKAAAAAKAKAAADEKARAQAAAKAQAQPSSSAAPATASTGTVSCTGTSGMLPQNYATIVTFLVGHGYTAIAAAGIAGNIYQESGGNPESVGSGGGGLIGWTPLPSGYVTGNVSADLQTQLFAILKYNDIWASYIPALNAASSPAAAAEIYVTDFERAGIPATSNRVAAAEAIAAACGI